MYDFLGERPDAYFGLTDGINDPDAITIDIDPTNKPSIVANWDELPFPDNHFDFSFWDPPYDKRYDAAEANTLELGEVCYNCGDNRPKYADSCASDIRQDKTT